MTEAPFVPKPGQIDYTHIRYAPVVNCILRCKEKILLVQRSAGMRTFPNLWSGISGFLDDEKSIEDKVRDELYEEAGIEDRDIISLERGPTLTQEDELHNKTWMVHSVIVEVRTENVLLDWESQNHAWIAISEVKNYPVLPGFLDIIHALEPQLRANSTYRHYKGGRYRILHEALHTDDEMELVIYESLQDGRRWARPKAEFFGSVETPEGTIPRFSLAPIASSSDTATNI